MLRSILFLLCLLLITNIEAQVKKPITHESMTMMKRVGAPEISPDGKWVVFSLTESSYNDKETVNDLWIVPSDGSVKPRRLTFGKGAESGYKWSPDSKLIAFSAKREEDEVSQVYILNIAEGGEAYRFSTMSIGGSAPQWSPDGKMIIFTAKVYPGNFTDSANKKTSEEKKKIKYNVRSYTSFPIRNWDVWIDEKQTHPFIQSIEPGSQATDIFTDVSITTKEGFNFAGAITWTPDGKEVVFPATIERNTAAYKDPVANLYRLSINGGDAVQLTNDGDQYGNPLFSSDGRYLLCLSSKQNNNQVYTLSKLNRFDWPSLNNRTMILPSLDRPLNNYVNAPGNKIYMSVSDQGNDKLMVADIIKNETTTLTTANGSYTAISISADATKIVSNYSNASKPDEIVAINKTGNTPLFLTSFNDAALATMDLPAPEVFWTKTSRGKNIRSMLIKPAGFDATKKYPLLVLMHGGPAGSWKDDWGYRWNYQLLVAPGYVAVLTDYTGSTGYGEKFSQEILYDPLKGPADEINEAADDAIKRFAFIDATRQAAAGGSYGGHLANWMQASTRRYKCLVAHAGMVNSEAQYATSDYLWGREVMNSGPPWLKKAAWDKQNPVRYAAGFSTPVLISVGEKDFRVPMNNSIENFDILQRLKVPSKLLVFPDENHWILKAENSRFWYKEFADWLKMYL